MRFNLFKKSAPPNVSAEDAISKNVTSFRSYCDRQSPINFIRSYQQNPIFASAIDMRADRAAQIRPIVLDNQTKEEVVNESSQKLIALFVSPGYGLDRVELMKTLCVHLEAFGACYPVIISATRRSRPITLNFIDPTHLELASDNTDHLLNEIRHTRGTRQESFFRDSLKNWRFYTRQGMKESAQINYMLDDTGYRPLSKAKSIEEEIRQVDLGAKYITSVYHNSAKPSGILTAKDATQQILDDLEWKINKTMVGTGNAGKVLVSDGSIDFKAMSMSLKDLEYTKVIQSSARAIYSRYNIPLTFLETDAMTYNNLSTSFRALYQDSVLVTYKTVVQGLGRLLLPRYGFDTARYSISFDPLSVEQIVTYQAEAAALLYQNGISTRNESRRMSGLPPLEGGDEPLNGGEDGV